MIRQLAARDSVDLSTRIGSVVLTNPVLTASGTSGHGAELDAYVDLSSLGAVVVKSVSSYAWAGNPPPRLRPVRDGMVNSVGLQGPGVASWSEDDLPRLLATGATVVASIWGRTVDEFARAAKECASAPSGVVAIEVNVSCPNLEAPHELFAASPSATASVLDATRVAGRPLWAKLSPIAEDLVAVARAALEAGAEALTLINTMPADAPGLRIEPLRGRVGSLGKGAGGLSGPALHPIALRAVHEVAAACPGVPIVAAGGVRSVADAVEFLQAGACAVEVGTATFLDPKAPARVLAGLRRYCEHHNVTSLDSFHRSGRD